MRTDLVVQHDDGTPTGSRSTSHFTQLHLRSIPKCSGSNLPRIREDRSTLPIENQSFVSSGDGVFIPAFSFPGFDSIPGAILAKHRPKFPTALRGLLAKPLLKQDR